MKVLLSWLNEFVTHSFAPAELAERLSRSGLEVESLRHLGEGLERVVIGRLDRVEPHPKADRLRICAVDVGEDEPVTILTAAENVRQGDIVPAALAGAKLTTGPIEPRPMRGVMSHGMLCSLYELGLEAKQGEGIYVLPAELEVDGQRVQAADLIGRPAAEVLGLDDWLMEVAPTPNRPDCLSMLGVAREVAALARTEAKAPDIAEPPGEDESLEVPEVRLEDEHCLAYHLARVRGLAVGPAPEWMRRRLHLSGFRAINNVVDVTNYVMHELGQPLHAFDRGRVAGGIVVRPARPDEQLTTIDGSKLALAPGMMVIADEREAQALAGVMGGLSSEVSAETEEVLLESAYFEPASVRRASLKANIHSDSAIRFRQGVDRLMVRRAFARALQLLHQVAAGDGFAWKARSAYSNDYIFQRMAEETPAPPITLRRARLARILGYEPDWDGVPGTLSRLGCRVEAAGPDELQAVPPSWRDADLQREIDLVEEVARLDGYDHIPVTLPRRTMPGRQAPRRALAGRCRRLLAGMGLTEAVTSSLIGSEALQVGPVALAARPVRNPITADLDRLRPNLYLSHLAVLRENVQTGQEDVHVFEIGQVFEPERPGQEAERWRLAGLLHGSAWQGLWLEPPAELRADFFAAKGAVMALLATLGLEGCRLEPLAVEGPPYHPYRAARVLLGDEPLGTLGEAHPELASGFGARHRVCLFDLDFDRLQALAAARPPRLYQPPSKFPAVFRDLAVVLTEPEGISGEAGPVGISGGAGPGTSQTAASVEAIIRAAGGPYLAAVACFDAYAEPGKASRSLAFHLIFRSPERTLAEQDVEGALGAILARLGDAGIQLRR